MILNIFKIDWKLFFNRKHIDLPYIAVRRTRAATGAKHS